ncbi:MAG: acyl-CoA thioesterase [Ignavibacteria bacterium]|nr:acyl-CoA thioesterase [Ignavibacteria bacterium]MCU7503114.1 acyl-CoA thioesterase [Ignavibacteria bacterium]MCU7516466.1 acyl-CoA thioesterase [Ignavibacteria bacterium]
MLLHKTYIRVRYADTDKMQFVYNGKYLEYFEVGRTELLRAIGLPYSSIEALGFQLPVLESFIRYKSPGRYDDLLEVEAAVKEMPRPKIHIDYVVRRSQTGEVLAEGYTEHVFMKEDTKKAVRPPQFYIDALQPHITEVEEKQ